MSRSVSEPESASLREVRVGQPAKVGEACHQRGNNELENPLGSSGWKRAARAERLAEEPGRAGTAGVMTSTDFGKT